MKRDFKARRETFGLETSKPWAIDALRLLFNVPRVYSPLAEAWDTRHPGTLRGLRRLTELGFVGYQGPVVVNTRSGELAPRPSKSSFRFRLTRKGRVLTESVEDDLRVLETDHFPRVEAKNTAGILRMMQAFNLEDSHAKYGLSIPHAQEISQLPLSNVKWWVNKMLAEGLISKLPFKLADTREVIPAHWRVTSALSRQLIDISQAFAEVPDSLPVQFRLGRSRYLKDIEPARIGISGATDFDHDVECQRITANLMRSDKFLSDGVFALEPRFVLPLDQSQFPWAFVEDTADSEAIYQPDGELREAGEHGVSRTMLEYERFQSRRDAWRHIERFLGFLATRTLPFESATLRFVVDNKARERGYVELIEAFCDYALDHLDRMPENSTMLAVSSSGRLAEADDPLSPRAWFRVELPTKGSADTARRPVLHPAKDAPYNDYFTRR